jgi:phospholipase/carboxylesterase
VDESVAETPAQRNLPHSLFAPHHYEPGYAYPLLVWLHGREGDEHELRCIMPYVSMQNYVAVSPRGCGECCCGSRGFEWRQDEDAIELAEQRVFEAIDIASARFNVAESRIFLAGYQCGGTMALRIGLHNPSQFAGVLSVGGPFPQSLAPLAYLRRARELPIFIAQGRESSDYPLQMTCEELRLFHAAAMHVTVRQYPCGDELTTQMLADMNAWIMERVTGVSETPCEEIPVYPGDALN